MKYEVSKALEILVRTPEVLRQQLSGLSDEWLDANEGEGTWSPFQVVGHLIINEETNFMSRASLILNNNDGKTLEPIDMTSHMKTFDGRSIDSLLSVFAELRNKNVLQLKDLDLLPEHLAKTALHPKLGEVRLSHILSAWVAHDLVHLGQITRVMAKQYKEEIGPFIGYLTRLR